MFPTLLAVGYNPARLDPLQSGLYSAVESNFRGGTISVQSVCFEISGSSILLGLQQLHFHRSGEGNPHEKFKKSSWRPGVEETTRAGTEKEESRACAVSQR